MTSRRQIHPGLPRLACTRLACALLACALLPGCLTRALWQESGESGALVEGRVDCEVSEVRGSLLGPRAEGELERIQISYAVRQTAQTPTELRGPGGGQTQKLSLRPRPQEGGSWLRQPGTELFRPLAWGFSLYRGSYFQAERVRARIAMEGLVRPEQIGAVVDERNLSRAWQNLPALAIPDHAENLVQTCLLGFVANRWLQILSKPGEETPCTQEALAFLGPEGEGLDPSKLEACSSARATPEDKRYFASCFLLGRLTGPWGETRYVRIALAVLLHGRELRLERLGSTVCWQRSQIWLADAVDGAGTSLEEAGLCSELPAIDLPLMTHSFVFTYAREDTGMTVLPTFLRLLATPPAMVLDWVWAHFAGAEEFMRWLLFKEKILHGPVTPGKN